MDRGDVILALVDAGGGKISGITRLQKLLFLLEHEYGVNVSGGSREFEAYRFGPYDPKLYDDLQFLENIKFLESRTEGGASEAAALDSMDFGFLAPTTPHRRPPSDEAVAERETFLSEATEGGTPEEASGDVGPEKEFRLTAEAKAHLDAKFREDPEAAKLLEDCKAVKKRFRTLHQLVRYVYENYPEFIKESEIQRDVLGE